MGSNRERFLAVLQEALAEVREPRLFKTARGYQGELLAGLKNRLADASFRGDPIIEQEYQKRIDHHGIRIRPELIIHVPFDRGLSTRRAGNFVAIELSGDPSPAAR